MPTFELTNCECSVRAAVYQAGLLIGAGITDRCDSGWRRAYRDGGLARHGAVARGTVPEILPGADRAEWFGLAANRRLLRALIEAFVPNGPLLTALDDTIERRRGARIAAKRIYRGPVRSSRSHVAKASGLRWLCLSLVRQATRDVLRYARPGTPPFVTRTDFSHAGKVIRHDRNPRALF